MSLHPPLAHVSALTDDVFDAWLSAGERSSYAGYAGSVDRCPVASCLAAQYTGCLVAVVPGSIAVREPGKGTTIFYSQPTPRLRQFIILVDQSNPNYHKPVTFAHARKLWRLAGTIESGA